MIAGALADAGRFPVAGRQTFRVYEGGWGRSKERRNTVTCQANAESDDAGSSAIDYKAFLAINARGTTSGRVPIQARFAFLEVHALDQTVGDGVDVPHLAIRKDIAAKAFHELMNFDLGNAAFLVDYLKWFHVRIKLLPLTGPVGPNLFFPDDTPAFRCLGPANVLTHELEGAHL
jgi:hypothetical protein